MKNIEMIILIHFLLNFNSYFFWPNIFTEKPICFAIFKIKYFFKILCQKIFLRFDENIWPKFRTKYFIKYFKKD